MPPQRTGGSGPFSRGSLSVTPIPTRNVSNGEFIPVPQTLQQGRVEYRAAHLADRAAGRLGISRRSSSEARAASPPPC